MSGVDILDLLEMIDISAREALSYAMYFDYKLQKGYNKTWDHFTIRAFILSVSRFKKGYYSVLRKVKDEVLFRDITELERMQWLKGWIFYKDKNGYWFTIVDGEKERFEDYKKIYEELKEQ